MARILIVDDFQFARERLKQIFIKAGHEVVAEAADGNTAFLQYEQHFPDIVTMDVEMPVVNGVDAVKKIIGSYPDANIVMVSAVSEKRSVQQAIQNGARYYVLKPIEDDKILRAVDHVLLSIFREKCKEKAIDEEPYESQSSGVKEIIEVVEHEPYIKTEADRSIVLKIAKRMIQKGLDFDIISEITELSMPEIENLAKWIIKSHYT